MWWCRQCRDTVGCLTGRREAEVVEEEVVVVAAAEGEHTCVYCWWPDGRWRGTRRSEAPLTTSCSGGLGQPEKTPECSSRAQANERGNHWRAEKWRGSPAGPVAVY